MCIDLKGTVVQFVFFITSATEESGLHIYVYTYVEWRGKFAWCEASHHLCQTLANMLQYLPSYMIFLVLATSVQNIGPDLNLNPTG
jgi:hypothetical protein